MGGILFMIEAKGKQKFYSALSNVFLGEVGANIEGNSGYTNLMDIRNKYFQFIKEKIEQKINKEFENNDKEDLYNKLFTFFESYLNETGTPFYYNTQIHKNLYEKIYSDKKDMALFWKTQKLYYVKSEPLFTSLKFDLNGIDFEFDAKEIEHQQNNEKKNVEFVLKIIDSKKVCFNVRYAYGKYNRLEELLDIKGAKNIKEYLYNNIDKINNSFIEIYKNDLNKEYFSSKTKFEKLVNIYRKKEGVIETAIIDLGLTKLKDIEDYAIKQKFSIDINIIEKAIRMYKRQNEVDYFIHKNAENFLIEQFNLYLFNYLFNDKNSKWTFSRIEEIQKIKEIAFEIISYIAKFEEELKEIWLKPKFVRNSNYVLTFNKLENNIELIEKIVQSDKFDNQIQEWKELYNEAKDDENEVIKKEWKEFEFINDFDKEDIIIKYEETKKLNDRYKYLPIDTKHFKDIEGEILDSFDNIDDDLDGILIKSDNFQALNTIKPKYKDNIDLVYIDPPFNTGKDFDYKDGYQDSTWLTLMENRLDVVYDLLKDSGSLYLHLDENANYLGRLLFESKLNFKREIIWDIQVLSGYKVKGADYNWILGHQSIYYFTKTNNPLYNKIMQPQSLKYLESFDRQDKDGKWYQVAHGRKIYRDDVEEKGKPFGDVWSILKDLIDVERPFLEVWDELTATIDFNKNKSSVWNDIMSFQQQPTASERIKFDTQKPEKLLERIIESATNEKGFVLDFFAGSGTTANTAQKMNRKYINIDMGEHFYSCIIPRTKRTLIGQQTDVARSKNYIGGGFFKYYELEQYEDTLKNVKYNSDEENPSLTFYNSEKLLDIIKIEDEEVIIDFKDIYPDVDIAETISNLTGRKIKKLNSERVIFTDGTEIKLNDIKWQKNKNLKPLFWWGE